MLLVPDQEWSFFSSGSRLHLEAVTPKMVSFQLARKTPPEIAHETSPSPTPTAQTLVDDGSKRAPTSYK